MRSQPSVNKVYNVHKLKLGANISCDITRERGTVETDRPGREIPKDYREVVKHLIDNQGWSYAKPQGAGLSEATPAGRR